MFQINGVFYAGIWFFFGMAMSIGNKFVFISTDFQFPVLLSDLHLIVNWGLVSIILNYSKFVPLEKKHLSSETKRSIRNFVLLFCLNIIFGNMTIKIVDLALSQMLRATMPVFSLILSYIMLGKSSTKYEIISLIPVVTGVVMISITNVQFSFWNVVVIIAGIVLCSLKGIQTHMTLKKHNIHPLVLLNKLAPISSIIMLLLAILFMDVPRLYTNFGLVFLNPSTFFRNTTFPLFTAVVAFFLNIFSFLANRGTSPLTMAVLGNVKQAMVIFLSIYFFKSNISYCGKVGILVTFFGLFLYTFARYHNSQRNRKKEKM